jgi:DNA-directed RNA polymerase subunit H (RpoH/RPB5)
MRRVMGNLELMLADRGYITYGHLELVPRNGPFYRNNIDGDCCGGIYIYIGRLMIKQAFGGDNLGTSKREAIAVFYELLRNVNAELENDMSAIIILPDQFLTVVDINASLNKINIYGESELYYNPTINALVPTHVIATDDDVKLLEKKIEIKALPAILVDDPICKWYGFKKGDILKIYRKYSNEVYYRLVS